MGVNILDLLKDIDVVAIDTAPFIYYIEEHVEYIETITPLFKLVDDGHIIAYTSLITLIEVLVRPIEEKNERLIQRYEDLLTNSNNLILTDIDKDVAVETARLRSKYNIKIPDAIQITSGIINGAKAFITNDVNLRKVKEIKVIVLSP